MPSFDDTFSRENRAHWRGIVQECLQGADPFIPCTWHAPADVARVLGRLCTPDLSYALEPGGGGYEFATALHISGDFFHLTTQAGSRHIIQVARLDYVPHPTDPADAVLRLELTPAAMDDSQGPVSLGGHRQGLAHPDGTSADPWPDHRWLHGTFVFTAKKGLFNEVDPDVSSWINTDAMGLENILAGLRHYEISNEGSIHPGHQRALRPLAMSVFVDTLPPGWIELWLESLPHELPPSAVRAAVEYVLEQRRTLPAFHEFRELCERARDGLSLSAPYITEEEENAQLILADLQKRYPELEESKLTDALLIAAAALYMRASQLHRLPMKSLVDGGFGPRARMFGLATVEWAEQALNGGGAWREFFASSTDLPEGDVDG